MKINDLSEERRREIAETLMNIAADVPLSEEEDFNVFMAVCLVCPELEEEIYQEGLEFDMEPVSEEEITAMMAPASERAKQSLKEFEEMIQERNRKILRFKKPEKKKE